MAALRRLPARARALPPRLADGLLALLVLAEGLLELVLSGVGVTGLSALAVGSVAAGVGLRRLSALLALALGFSGLILAGVAQSTTEETVGPFLCLLMLLVWVGAHLEGSRFALGVALGAAGLVTSVLTDAYATDGEDFIFGIVMLVCAPLFLGRFLRHRATLNAALRRRAEQLELEREERARLAVVEERRRIASELHDAVAHALSGMVVQAAGARRLVPSDPERAREAFGAVEDSGREALGEMRRLLGVLRREDAELALHPQPTLAQLPALLRRSREEGLDVSLEVVGDPPAPGLAPGLDLTAYRLVQAALGGAAAEGAARAAQVRVRYAPERLEIEVCDDGAAPAGGRPLPGVRERVAVHGGELVASARPGAGHAVRARIPLGAAA